VIAPLGDIVDRAALMAAPAAGRRATIVTDVPRAAGVRNRGKALEGLLAALIIDLAKSNQSSNQSSSQAGAGARVRVDADVGRLGLAIELQCDGARLEPSSWRLALAKEIAAKLDATLTVHPDASAYLVQIR
jgi:hypothetical protein